MCGIMGFFRWELFKREDKTKLWNLLVKSFGDLEERGKDASGIALINTENNKYLVFKKGVKASELIKENAIRKTFLREDFNLILLHTRAWTNGKPDNNLNNHPFFDKDKNNILIHNGIIRNFREVIDNEKLKVDGECDSEVILSLFNKTKSISETLSKLEGSMALALYSKNVLYLFKEGSPLDILYFENDKMFAFASKEEYILDNYPKREFKVMNIFTTSNLNYLSESLDDEDLVIFDFKKSKINTKEVKIKESSYVWSYSNMGGWSNAAYDREERNFEERKELTELNEQDELNKLNKPKERRFIGVGDAGMCENCEENSATHWDNINEVCVCADCIPAIIKEEKYQNELEKKLYEY